MKTPLKFDTAMPGLDPGIQAIATETGLTRLARSLFHTDRRVTPSRVDTRVKPGHDGVWLPLAILLVSLAPAAQAQPIDPAVMAEAPHYMEVTGKTALLNNQIEALRQTAILLMADSPVPPARRGPFVDRVIMPELRAAAPDLLAQWASIYVADTTLDDMKAAEAFFATPAGQHLLASEAQVTNSLRSVTIAWQETAMRQAFARHADELRSAELLQE